AFEAPLVQIVEEESADAAGFVAMLEEEIAIAPILVPRIRVISERCARVASGAMPVQHVFFERVVRGEVETAAEPPHRAARRPCGEEAHVRVRRRYVRIQRMDDE